jgi:hypothetical protein
MRRFSKPFRNRSEIKQAPARRSQRCRLQLEPLEDRCLLSVSLSDGGATSGLVGSPVTWTATATGDGASPVYQFSVQSANSPPQVVQDYSTSNSFTWNPLQEGNYTIEVNVEENVTVQSIFPLGAVARCFDP